VIDIDNDKMFVAEFNATHGMSTPALFTPVNSASL